MSRMRFPRSVNINGEKSTKARVSQEGKPGLTVCISWIVDKHAMGIGKSRDSFLERNPMLGEIGSRLVGIPFEGKSHGANVGSLATP
jgi:hypothetical protein